MSPRSGRQHKAWGGAKRNPRTTVQENLQSPRRADSAMPDAPTGQWPPAQGCRFGYPG